jgi:hypothetical protein
MEPVAEPARRSADAASADPAVAVPEAPALVTPADLLDLQRHIGNTAATQVLARRDAGRAKPRLLQRLVSSNELQDFALSYHETLEQLRAMKKPQSIVKHHKALTRLVDRATQAELDRSHPRMFTVLKGLADCATGARPATDVPTLLGLSDPAQLGAVGTVAAATFTPRTAKGAYVDKDMQALLEHHQAQQGDQTYDPAVRMNIAISAVEQAYRRHQAAVKGLASQRENLMVFLGPEWFFGRTRPYSQKEYADTVRRIVAASALYPDVVFIPGTILTYKSQKGGTYRGIANFAPVAWHGRLITTIQKGGNAGDWDVKEEFLKGQGDPTFTIGDLKLVLDICADHFSGRARGFTKDADVQLVTSSGQDPLTTTSGVKPMGFMFGADIDYGGAKFRQADPTATNIKTGHEIGAETLAYGDVDPRKGQRRLLDYMPPKARGAPVAAGDRVTFEAAEPWVKKPGQARKIEIVDVKGGLKTVTV